MISILDNGIVERFHKTVLDEFYRVALRKKIYGPIADLQVDLDRWVQSYNEERPHQGDDGASAKRRCRRLRRRRWRRRK